MKEAFWGVLIIVLGLFGIVVVNLFQNITVDNDRVYYVIKESTEAAAFDAIDLAHYRLNGTLRIVEDKFIENLTRRFAENISKGNYKIVVEDVNEMPPKVSLRVETNVGVINTGMFGREDPFNIVNRVDAIIETKYKKEDLEDMGITIETPDDPIIDDVCKPTIGATDDGCIDGDIMFTGHEDINIQNKICTGDTPPSNVNKKVNYKVCECGSWVEKTETLVSSPRKNGREWIYEWIFYKEGKNKVINQVIREKVLELQCTNGIQILVPDDINEKNQNNVTIPYQPSTDNSRYEICPPEGIKIPLGMSFIAHPNYLPTNSVNRNLIWKSSDSNVLGINGTNPSKYCELNSKNSNCLSVAKITANKLGTAYINVETTNVNGTTPRGQKATCKVEVYDGNIDSLSCKDMNLEIGKSGVIEYNYLPKNATKVKLTYSIDNTKLASITGNTITAKEGGPVTITVKETNTGKIATCKLTIPSPVSSGGSSSGGSSGNSYYSIVFPDGTKKFYGTIESATKAATSASQSNNGQTINIKYNGGNGNGEILNTSISSEKVGYSTTTITGHYGFDGRYDGSTVKTTSDPPPSTSGNKESSSSSSSSGNKTGTSTNWGNSKPGSYNPYVPNSKPTPPKPTPPKPSKPSSSGGCLEENTKILTTNGYKSISDIKEGDMVLSYNYELKKNEFKMVTMVYKHLNMKDVLYSIVVNNKVIKATRLHRFYVKTTDGYKYVKVEDLKFGDLLMDSKGNYHPIRKLTSKFMVSDYYDIEVEDNHNYYISRDNILVHNAASKH